MKRARQYAVITGASAGIGAEFARRFAKEGYSLVLVARREDRLQDLKLELMYDLDEDARCVIIAADLSKMDVCEAVANRLEKIPVSVFINNAGCGD